MSLSLNVTLTLMVDWALKVIKPLKGGAFEGGTSEGGAYKGGTYEGGAFEVGHASEGELAQFQKP